jgi:hypothetical protein
MSTVAKPREVIWNEWPDDAHLTDAVIAESRKARAELEAAMAQCDAVFGEARGAQ